MQGKGGSMTENDIKKISKEIAKEILDDFQNFLNDKPRGFDSKDNKILVGVTDKGNPNYQKWEYAVDEYLKEKYPS